MSFPEMPWKVVATDDPTGREVWLRTVAFRHTGNNEGTMTGAIEVRTAGGTVIASTEMTIEWEYFGSIEAAFGDGGATVTITGSDGGRKEMRLPAAESALQTK